MSPASSLSTRRRLIRLRLAPHTIWCAASGHLAKRETVAFLLASVAVAAVKAGVVARVPW